ncbi:hypothetical protein V8G54_022923 [Vigna mungo]|uniref:Uncharacterized protein n=1 Tax=Vigna mungo TaxID=3915 RepID=A0AAQ3RPU7_VIGMU
MTPILSVSGFFENLQGLSHGFCPSSLIGSGSRQHVLAFGETDSLDRGFITLLPQTAAIEREGNPSVARFASMEDDFANCAAHGSMKKTNLVVGEDDGLGALHNRGKDCHADDEALNLDDSWFHDLGEIATLMVMAIEVARDGCHGSLQVRLQGDMVTLDDHWFGGLKVEEDGDMAVVKCHLNTVVQTWIVRR